MRIAVVGSGIAGLAGPWLLAREHEVVLYEAEARLGGHTHTHEVAQQGRRYAVDSGFIVFNPDNYPLLSRLLAELGVDSQPTTMSFAVHDEASGFEYGTTTVDALFCQRRNLLSPAFYGMVRDLTRFYRESPTLLQTTDAGPTLGDYLREHRYGAMFRDRHIVPMASALWSSPSDITMSCGRFPVTSACFRSLIHSSIRSMSRPPRHVPRLALGISFTISPYDLYDTPCRLQRSHRYPPAGLSISSFPGNFPCRVYPTVHARCR